MRSEGSGDRVIPLRYNLRSLAVRRTTTLATSLGIGLVVFVLAAALMLSNGIKKTLATSGQPDVAMVMRSGSDNEMSSNLEEPSVHNVLSAPGVRKDEKGGPVGTSEIVVVAAMEKLGANGISNVLIRGVRDNVMAFRPTVRIVDGRPARPGTDEVIIGSRIRGRFRGLDLGGTFELRKTRPVQIVGIFEDGGSAFESEVWVDLDAVRQAYGREGSLNVIRVRLESPEAYEPFKLQVESDKNLGFMAIRETEYYERQSEGTSLFIGAMGTLISVFFAVGAMIGAMITMYSAVANRQKEIGTLRALGFSRRSILASFLMESMLLALLGGILGAAASMAMGLVHFSMMNMASWSEIVFSFSPTPKIILAALCFAGGMGLFGGLFPAIRATRVSAIQAIRG
jgi:putative ABC transport system permease protein